MPACVIPRGAARPSSTTGSRARWRSTRCDSRRSTSRGTWRGLSVGREGEAAPICGIVSAAISEGAPPRGGDVSAGRTGATWTGVGGSTSPGFAFRRRSVGTPACRRSDRRRCHQRTAVPTAVRPTPRRRPHQKAAGIMGSRQTELEPGRPLLEPLDLAGVGADGRLGDPRSRPGTLLWRERLLPVRGPKGLFEMLPQFQPGSGQPSPPDRPDPGGHQSE